MANFLDDLFKRIFTSSGRQALNVRENFIIKDSEQRDMEVWLVTEEAQTVFDRIYKNYHFKRAAINESPEVHIFESPYANGLAVSYDFPLNPKSFSLLFLAFGQRIIALGYEQISLDRKLEETEDQVRVTEKFYFKPPHRLPGEKGPISQLYGNVTLEKVTLDNKPSHIKLLATVYSDRQYQSPKPFDQLVDRIFEKATDG